MKREKEPMSMEEYADRILEKLFQKYVWHWLPKETLYDVIFDSISMFQELQDEKYRNPKEERDEMILEKQRQLQQQRRQQQLQRQKEGKC